GPPAGPLEQRWLRAELRVAEADVPVHAAAVGLVLRVPAPAERIVLERCAGVAGHRLPVGVGELDAAGDPVRAVPSDLDGRVPGVGPGPPGTGFGGRNHGSWAHPGGGPARQ